jgi:hypothetical protein
VDDDGVRQRKGVFEADPALFRDFVDCFLANDVALLGDGGGRDWLVAGDHNDLDAGGLALDDREGDVISWWVDQRNYANKALLFEREVGILDIEVKAMREF